MHPPKQFKLAVTLAVSYFTLMLGSFRSSISLIDFFHSIPVFDVGYVSQPKLKFLTFLFWILQPPTSWIGHFYPTPHHPIPHPSHVKELLVACSLWWFFIFLPSWWWRSGSTRGYLIPKLRCHLGTSGGSAVLWNSATWMRLFSHRKENPFS